jgi:hypothetical protein
MSVLRTALDPDEAGHEDALGLLHLAPEGVLEVGVPPQGVRADFRDNMTTPQAPRVVALVGSRGMVELQQLAVPSKFTFAAKDFSPRSRSRVSQARGLRSGWTGMGRAASPA